MLKSLAEPLSLSDKLSRDSRPAGIDSGLAYSPEVSPLSGEIMSCRFRHSMFCIPLAYSTLNPYPHHYNAAFAFSRILYPLSHQIASQRF
jgi:hypothetical protein